MSEELLRTIADHPDDDTPRLVYADWLEEHGEAERAEYIRLECRYPSDELYQKENREAYFRRVRLQADNYKTWGEPLFRCGVKEYQTERGLIHSIRITPRNFAKHAEAIFQAAPALYELVLDSPYDRVGALADSPTLGKIRAVKFSFGALRPLRDRGLITFARSDHLGRLAKLSLDSHEITSQGLRALAESPSVGSLEELELTSNRLADEGAELLADSPRLAKARRCELALNRIGLAGITALTASRFIPDDAEWGIAHNPIGDEGWLRILESPRSEAFYPFVFSGMNLSETAIEHLVRFADRLPGVDAFRWWDEKGFGPNALRRLGNSEFFARIRDLDLENFSCLEAALCELIRSDRFAGVRNLSLRNMGLTRRICEAIASSLHVGNLEELDLSRNRITDTAVRLLTNSDNLVGLKQLEIWDRKFRRKTVELLESRFESVLVGED